MKKITLAHCLRKAVFAYTTCLMLTQAQSSQPIDPLKRPEVAPLKLDYGFSLGYTPSSVFEPAETGVLLVDNHQLIANLSVGTDIDDQLTATVASSFGLNVSRSMLPSASTQDTRAKAEFLGVSAGLDIHINPNHPLDPTLNISVGYPFALSGQYSLSFLRDPVIASGAIGLTYVNNLVAASVSGGVGFVANDAVSFKLDNQWQIGISAPIPITYSATFSYLYSDPSGEGPSYAVPVKLSTSVVGTKVGFGLSVFW